MCFICMRHSSENKRVWAVTLPETEDGSFSYFTQCAHLGQQPSFSRICSFLFPVAPSPPHTSSIPPCHPICHHNAITKSLENAQQKKENDWRLSLTLRTGDQAGYSVPLASK